MGAAIYTYNQIANENLKDLCLQARAARKQLLEDADQDMAQRRADESSVRSHLWHS